MEKTGSAAATAASANSKLPTQSVSSTTNLQKIAPKPQLIKTQGNKFVYIKNANGGNQPIRIGGQTGTATGSVAMAAATATAAANTIQLIKTSDGNIIQIKNKMVPAAKTSVDTTATLTVSSDNSTRFVLKSGTGSRLVLATPPTAKGNATPLAAGSNTRTLTVSQAQKMGLLTQANLKEIVSAANANKAASTTAASTTAANAKPAGATIKAAATSGQKTNQPPTILNKCVKSIDGGSPVLIQSSAASANTQNIVKLNATSQIRAVNVAGKGVQYVRVLTSGAAAGVASSAAKVSMANGRQPPLIVQRKIVPSALGSGQKAPAATIVKSQFVTKKLEVTPIDAATAQLNSMMASRTKDGAAGHNAKPILLNAGLAAASSASSDSKLSVSQISIKSSPTSPPLSPAGSPQKIIYRTYKLGEEQKSTSPNSQQQTTTLYSNLKLPSPEPAEGIRRKHCNCTKSQCLKLYCDCFANGEFCSNCNCKECFNTLEREDERQKAIKICLERNPHAFKPKIGKARDQSDALRRHTKGCNCKRSGCLKNYCECYEAKIVCSGNCKCIGCRNTDESFDNSVDRDTPYENNLKRTYDSRDDSLVIKRESSATAGGDSGASATSATLPAKRACNFITSDVIEATIQCVIAQADDCQKNNYDARISERKILEEFGRCLVEIIDFSKKNMDNGDSE